MPLVSASVYGITTDSSTGISYAIVMRAACEGGTDQYDCTQPAPGNMRACEELGYMSLTTSEDCLTGGLAFSSDAPYDSSGDAYITTTSSGRTGGCQIHMTATDADPSGPPSTPPDATIYTGGTGGLQFFTVATGPCGQWSWLLS